MRQQHEITTSGPLLGSDGNLLEPGWARSLLPVYRRADIKAGAMRIKEWDYYLITDGHIGLALTIADNGYMGLDSVSFLDFDGKWEKRPAGCVRCRWAGRSCRNRARRARRKFQGAAMPWPSITRTGRGCSRSTWTNFWTRSRSRALSSSPTSRPRAWSSPRPLTSPDISITTRRSTVCAPRAGSSWAAAGTS